MPYRLVETERVEKDVRAFVEKIERAMGDGSEATCPYCGNHKLKDAPAVTILLFEDTTTGELLSTIACFRGRCITKYVKSIEREGKAS